MLIVIKVLTWMASPVGFLTWGSILGLALWFLKWKKTGVSLMATAVLQTVVFSSPSVSDYLIGSLEEEARVLQSKNQQAQRILSGERYGAIVLLGGATSPAYPPIRPHPDLGDATDRIWHAARLYKQGVAPKIIVSGGRSPGMENRADIQTEAQIMRQLLLDLGVPDSAIALENEARTTRENAEKTKSLVNGQQVALVTSASHMPRSIKTFEKIGVTVHAYPTDFRVAPQVSPLWDRLLPKSGNLEQSEAAIKELIALAIGYY